MKRYKYNNLCLVGSIYSLLVYLSFSTDEDIKKTLFVLTDQIPKEISSKIKGAIIINQNSFFARKWYIAWIYWKVFFLMKIPYIKKMKIFANDHLAVSPIIIGSNNYYLIEDSAFVCSQFFYGKRKIELQSFIEKKTYKIKQCLLGKTLYKHNGYNNQCIGILQTTQDNAPYTQDKKKLSYPLFDKWRCFSDFKKDFIQNIYGVLPSDMEKIKSKEIILFTQPLYVDYISEEEHKEIYSKIISHYPIDKILIKTHPRDNFDYKTINPVITVFNKKIPSQFFDLHGIRYSTAVTVCSSAVKNFNYELSIDWFGAECNEKLLQRLGTSFIIPQGANLCKL